MTENSIFQNSLKHAGIKPVYKNYRPVSILLNLSKIYERCTYTQLKKSFDPIFSKYQFGLRKGYSTQQSVLGSILFNIFPCN